MRRGHAPRPPPHVPRPAGGGGGGVLWRAGGGGFVAGRVAADAAIGLDDVEELALALDVRVDAVATWSSARERRLFRHLDHRVPVDGGIIFGGRLLVRRLHGGEI